MKAIDRVGGESRRLLCWEEKQGCGSENVFKWAERVGIWQN